MAKKKKYIPSVNKTKPASSRNQQEQAYRVAKKMLQHIGIDSKEIDVFTKKQFQNLMSVWFEPPIVKPKIEKTIPRQYVRNIHTGMHYYMRNHVWDNSDDGLTYMDVAIYGASFLVNLSNLIERGSFLKGSPQEILANKICEKYNATEVVNNMFNELLIRDTWQETRGYSRINYRMYGYDFEIAHTPRVGGVSMRPTIYLTAQESEVKKFSYKSIERKAFRVINMGTGWSRKSAPATIKRNRIFPSAKEDEELNIYVQSHVLQRLKERLDAFDTMDQNILIQYALTVGLKTVSFEKQILFSCTIENGLPVGYFTFFVQDTDVVITTFIPLSSADGPEGKKLNELFPLSKEDIVYLGMDKLSFYLNIDFEQIPILKEALINSGIWETKLILDRIFASEEEDNNTRINLSKTKFVKDFFNKLESYPKD